MELDALYNIVLTITIFDLALIIATQMLMGSMVADIVEDSEVQTGRRSEGIFYAGISFIRKLAQASGVFVATHGSDICRYPGRGSARQGDGQLADVAWLGLCGDACSQRGR
jgi:hypothetical protein